LRATGGANYKWSPVEGLSNPDIANPLATPTKTTTYTVVVSNGGDCEATAEITITVIPRITIVNTFSPNRDGINEVWEIQNIEQYPEATVEIFNRYGAPVFKSNGYAVPWDGTNKGNPLPLATYYYIIRLNQNEKPFTGSVTIIR
jgi:gliding motility-associated-like protein